MVKFSVYLNRLVFVMCYIQILERKGPLEIPENTEEVNRTRTDVFVTMSMRYVDPEPMSCYI